jgi:hypothetical protein
VLLNISGQGLNHVGVNLGDQLLLNHCRGRLSSRDLLDGCLLKCVGWVGRLKIKA